MNRIIELRETILRSMSKEELLEYIGTLSARCRLAGNIESAHNTADSRSDARGVGRPGSQ